MSTLTNDKVFSESDFENDFLAPYENKKYNCRKFKWILIMTEQAIDEEQIKNIETNYKKVNMIYMALL